MACKRSREMSEKKQDLMIDQSQDIQVIKPDQQTAKQISLPPVLTVKQLAELLGVTPVDIIKQLMRNGMMANINQTIDFNVASVITENFGYKVKRQPAPPKTKPSAPAKATKGG